MKLIYFTPPRKYDIASGEQLMYLPYVGEFLAVF
jgi:hypothetical protein